MLESAQPPPLKGIRVLDFTSIVAGPLATLVLASLGADIIKVERMDGGDDSRHMGPHLGNWGSVFVPLNRGKRSLAVDITKPAGRDLILRLARKTDVFIENLRGGKMDALGLGEEAIRNCNPKVIYASLTAFGSHGPDALSPGYEALIQGRSGIMSVTGPGPDAMPVRAGVPIIDGSAGLWIAISILAALFQRQKSGEGQQVNTSLLEAGVMIMFHNLVGQQFSGSNPVPQGSLYPAFGKLGGSFSPYGAFQTADGWLMIGVSNDRIFARLCKAIERTEWASDPRFLTNVLRVNNRATLNEMLNQTLRQKSTAHWKAVSDVHDVPVSAIQDCEQVLNDPQVDAINQLDSIALPGHEDKSVKVPRVPVHMSLSPTGDLGLPPSLGEHTREVLTEAGYTESELNQLVENGACKLP
jgi:crotonobetainyl-CoA:carnitine CoA-transferase CaiB-like acyl-CoA transferase